VEWQITIPKPVLTGLAGPSLVNHPGMSARLLLRHINRKCQRVRMVAAT